MEEFKQENGCRDMPTSRFRRRTDEEIIRLAIVDAKVLPNPKIICGGWLYGNFTI
jgi:hypothetical protein